MWQRRRLRKGMGMVLSLAALVLASAVKAEEADGSRSLAASYNAFGQVIFGELARKPGNIVY
ncbi:MAG: hypothetical protein JO124_00330, partial [Hyphomicrobiales bacterium]|nr:hypothetical protein [Hyphomicrobiales bacterium]